MRINLRLLLLVAATAFCIPSSAQGSKYPFPVKFFQVKVEGQTVKMAYMDEVSEQPNGKTVLLLHGKNFNGYYWKDAIHFLRQSGYRVITPDQVGWGKSEKPTLKYSFKLLANNSLQLLDSLKVAKAILVGHSMGGMLATRFALDYPERVEKLVLENPIGLEDYKLFVPYQSIDTLYQKEIKATYASYKKYQQSYYPVWKPEYEQFVVVQAEALKDKNFRIIALINALTYQMIYEEPVVEEMQNLKVPTLLIIGQEDRTVVGKNLLQADKKMLYGNYPSLGKLAHKKIPGSLLVELKGVGHLPHIQTPALFKQHLLEFLNMKQVKQFRR